MWQEILTGIVVAGAVFYLVRRFFFTNPSEAGCSGCQPGAKSSIIKEKKQ